MTDTTLNYYDNNAEAFIKGTISVDFSATQDKFLNILSGKRILDFGCVPDEIQSIFLKRVMRSLV